MLEVEIYNLHPLLRAFKMVLQEQVIDTKTRSSNTDGPAVQVPVEPEACKSQNVQL